MLWVVALSSMFERKEPLWLIALLNKPFAEGIAIKVFTFAPPPDCPKTVTFFASPPKEAMFSFTHSKAARISNTLLFAEYLYFSP